ncbi:hypothetical protein [Lysinibacillus xylanilyticus]|uniref:hypothetical protein n=1 Tax=Lysinibacillus xylanilyticus TaxID=582475 RepID=UPI0036DDF29A
MYSGNQASYHNLSENMKQKLEGLKTSIVNDLTTGGSDKALSAESGKELKSLVDEKADGKDLESLQTEITKHLADNTSHTEWIETVGGTANALTATIAGITSYKNGLGVSFPVKSNSTAAMSLNINGLGAIPIKKANGTAFSNGIANGVYTVRYRDGAFYLQGESEVEIGKQIIIPGTTNKAILKGVHDGTGYVEGSPNLVPSNIKSGVNIFGVVGTALDIQLTAPALNASDQGYKSWTDNYTYKRLGTTNMTPVYKIKIGASGTIRVTIQTRVEIPEYYGTIRILKNGAYYTEWYSYSTNFDLKQLLIDVKPGDIFEVLIMTGHYNWYVEASYCNVVYQDNFNSVELVGGTFKPIN